MRQALAGTVFGAAKSSWYRHASGAPTNPWPDQPVDSSASCDVLSPSRCVIRARRRNIGERGPTLYPSGPHGY
ncbi:hypothetical protein GCM10027088_68180 [Nocardia goodfellowii]